MKTRLVIGSLVLLLACTQALPDKLLFNPEVTVNICPDRKGVCPPQTTCCGLKNGGYACCPVPEATCCSDNEHCCPKGHRCDVKSQQCVHEDGNTISWSSKVPTTPAPQEKIAGRSVICPDEKSQCMDHQTCCKMKSGDWACCPLPEAVCCDDQQHCCPHSYKCDSSSSSCIKTLGSGSLLSVTVPWMTYMTSTSSSSSSSDSSSGRSDMDIVTCDAEISCRDNQTCCKTVTGSWACCPLPKAVCCQDKLHCCPSGYRCQPSSGMCLKEGLGRELGTLPLFEVVSSGSSGFSHNDVKCDDESSCPDQQTCCKMATGKYGCCPLPEAVCCSDKVHCCPHGYTCNVAAGTCDMLGVQIPWSTKVPALQTPLQNSEKQEKLSEEVAKKSSTACTGGAWCKSGSTCCQSTDGSLRGCCNLENAVCCADGTHCCPSGTSCDAGMCRSQDSTLSLSWYQTRPIDGFGSLRSLEVAAGVQCPDGSSCPTGATCCQLPSKQYACCPYEKGVCCQDQLHCCPHDMTCDVEHSRCVSQAYSGFSLPWNLFSRNRARHPQVLERDLKLTLSKDTCPDLSSVCAENTTCCLTQSGAYGCCPHKNAVCCSDKLHCCPYGTTCDVAKQACVASDSAVTNNNAEKEESNNNNVAVEEDDSNDIPFPAVNPYRRLN